MENFPVNSNVQYPYEPVYFSKIMTKCKIYIDFRLHSCKYHPSAERKLATL
jgi:hypothetical protein